LHSWLLSSALTKGDIGTLQVALSYYLNHFMAYPSDSISHAIWNENKQYEKRVFSWSLSLPVAQPNLMFQTIKEG
jgi:hypothetical protein